MTAFEVGEFTNYEEFREVVDEYKEVLFSEVEEVRA